MRRGRVIASAILPVLGFAFSASCQAKAYDCLMEPMQTVEISSPVAGVLETVLVKRGDPVKKGQVIATLDSRTERAARLRRSTDWASEPDLYRSAVNDHSVVGAVATISA